MLFELLTGENRLNQHFSGILDINAPRYLQEILGNRQQIGTGLHAKRIEIKQYKVKQTFELNKRLINKMMNKFVKTYITIFYKIALIAE